MASTTYTDFVGPVLVSAWLNDVNAATYDLGVPITAQGVQAQIAALVATTLPVPQLSGKSRLINGAMNVWQRGTSFLNTANSYQYMADRWAVFGGVGTVTIGSQVSTGLPQFPLALRVQRQSGSTGVGNVQALQEIETLNCRDLAGQTITLSAYIRAGAGLSGTVNMVVSSGTGSDQGITSWLSGGWGGQAQSGEVLALTTGFVKYNFTYTVPAGTNELLAEFYYTPTGTAGASDYFDVTGVQLEAGAVATPFEFHYFGDELRNCQRYYEGSYDYGTVAGGITYTGALEVYISGPSSFNGFGLACPFKANKRAAPTMTYYSPATGAAGKLRDVVNGVDVSVTQGTLGTTSSYVTATMTAANYINAQGHWVANSEL